MYVNWLTGALQAPTRDGVRNENAANEFSNPIFQDMHTGLVPEGHDVVPADDVRVHTASKVQTCMQVLSILKLGRRAPEYYTVYLPCCHMQCVPESE